MEGPVRKLSFKEEIISCFGKKCADCLFISSIFITHTHTHTHTYIRVPNIFVSIYFECFLGTICSFNSKTIFCLSHGE